MALVGEMKYLTIGENTYSISAGAKTFIVTLTESNGVYTSDKTAEEIYTAFNAGDTILLDCGSYVLLSSVYGENDYYQADFYKSEASTGSFNLHEYMIVTNNGVTSVDYNLYNTPVNNGSLVIQKNGSTVGTFSANSSSNITANITVPTKVSDLTNDSGYITTYTETDPTVPAWAKQPTKPSYVAAEVGALPDNTQIPSKTSDLVNDSGFITGYTETDPVFSASAAAGITSADITNWNNKISDDKTWNGVTLEKDTTYGSNFYVPNFSSTSASSAKLTYVTATPSAGRIPRYDDSSYLYSTTPSANDNSTKVATTAYVDNKETATTSMNGLMSASDKAKLDGIASGAEVNVQSNWSQSDSTADDYIKNKPTIPTVNNATLTIQKNGRTVSTFTANASSDVMANISVPTEASEIGAQPTLVSGANIKTINNQSLLGSGNITVSTTAAQIIRWTESA